MKRFLGNPTAILLILIMVYQSLSSGRYNSPMDWFMSTIIILPGIIVGISFHEFAHAKVAELCGDPTPKLQGRVTVNPMAHIDPIGFIALLFIGFGWGRPVIINPGNFKKPRFNELLVALAGVTMNLILAFLFMGLLRLLYEFQPGFMFSERGIILGDVLIHVVLINIVLMVFNLLPIPPLDGFNIVTQIFNLRNTNLYYQIYNKGFLILMVLILFNLTDRVLTPSVFFVYDTLATIFF
ncbi:MAG: site-2 protease family protein [Eubacteriales bacterium]|nr:site-2 protease family protein [Eubacteriales bacterium]MDD4583019.1 site-2 protease family protein [Eubacteriales bacterium]